MREIVLCDIRQAENQEALVVKSSMEKKRFCCLTECKNPGAESFFKKKEKKSPRRQLQMSCFVRLSKTDQNTKAIRAQ